MNFTPKRVTAEEEEAVTNGEHFEEERFEEEESFDEEDSDKENVTRELPEENQSDAEQALHEEDEQSYEEEQVNGLPLSSTPVQVSLFTSSPTTLLMPGPTSQQVLYASSLSCNLQCPKEIARKYRWPTSPIRARTGDSCSTGNSRPPRARYSRFARCSQSDSQHPRKGTDEAAG
jgi:hypothetical protein